VRQRTVRNQDEILNNSSKYVKDTSIKKGNWKSKTYKEMHIEIGIGKGTFITTLASKNPDILYIGIELSKPVLALATKKIRRFEEENNTKLTNLLIFDKDATMLDEIFNRNEVDKIYLNFSDPWPKNKHTKRRLTSPDFLKVYRNILKENGKVEFKTDNRKLFEYSLLTLNEAKVIMEYISLDLHKEDIPNIVTEYEEKFSKFGPIYKLIFSFR